METYNQQQKRSLAKDIKDLFENKLEDIKILVNDEDLNQIQAVIDGPKDTPYENGKFNVKLVMCSTYPNEPPKGFFLTKIFHPNVHISNGEICVNTLKEDWKPNLGIKHVLLTIRCLLVAPNPESALNEEAGKLLLEQYSDYVARAKMFTEIYACSHLKNKFCLNNNGFGNDKKPSLTTDFKAAKKALKQL